MIYETKFLSNLNRALKVIEKEIIERATACLEIEEKKLKNNDPFTTGYEVEAKVEYYINDDDLSAHTFWISFPYKKIALHDLLDHSMPRMGEKILEIEGFGYDFIKIRKGAEGGYER